MIEGYGKKAVQRCFNQLDRLSLFQSNPDPVFDSLGQACHLGRSNGSAGTRGAEVILRIKLELAHQPLPMRFPQKLKRRRVAPTAPRCCVKAIGDHENAEEFHGAFVGKPTPCFVCKRLAAIVGVEPR
jgi:hypothetical protein